MTPEDLLRGSVNRALKPCPTCGKEIAKSARTCPHCGKSFTTAGGVFWAIVVGLILGGFFMWKG